MFLGKIFIFNSPSLFRRYENWFDKSKSNEAKLQNTTTLHFKELLNIFNLSRDCTHIIYTTLVMKFYKVASVAITT